MLFSTFRTSKSLRVTTIVVLLLAATFFIIRLKF
jgi:hypothetical protein